MVPGYSHITIMAAVTTELVDIVRIEAEQRTFCSENCHKLHIHQKMGLTFRLIMNLKCKNDGISSERFLLLVQNNLIKKRQQNPGSQYRFYLGHMLLCHTSKLADKFNNNRKVEIIFWQIWVLVITLCVKCSLLSFNISYEFMFKLAIAVVTNCLFYLVFSFFR